MADALAPLVRILLRWLGGFLIAKGLASSPDAFTDPDLVTVICFAVAGICGLVSEGWWALARRRGWSR
jgi:hypothetical protein